MDRPPQPSAPVDRLRLQDRALSPDANANPWGLENPEAPEQPRSIRDIREVYLRWRERAASSAVETPSRLITIARRMSAWVPSRRIIAGVAMFGVAAALLVALSRRDAAPSLNALAGTTYNTALDRLASAVDAALNLVGMGPAATPDAALASTKKVPSVNAAAGRRKAITAARAHPVIPLISSEAVHANGPAPLGDADVDDGAEPIGTAIAQEDSGLETSPIYSSSDIEISPPIALRSPGIATGRGDQERNILFIDVLVSENGAVESARGRQRPATLGAALQANMALSVVRTWRFSPARKDGAAVRYRTTVPFVETLSVSRD